LGTLSTAVADQPKARGQTQPAAVVAVTPSVAVVQNDDRFRVRLADGAVIELVGVTEHPSEGCRWWRADGSPLSAPPIVKEEFAQMNRPRRDQVAEKNPGDFLREFIVRVTTPDCTATVQSRCLEAYDQGQGPGLDVIDGKLQINHHFAAAIAAVPGGEVHYFERSDDSRTVRTSAALAVDLDVDFSSGPWKTVASCGPNMDCSAVFEEAVLDFGLAAEIEGKAAVCVAHNYAGTNLDMRLVAAGQNGSEVTMERGSTSSSGYPHRLSMIKAIFPLSLAKVKEFRFQTRPIRKIRFCNVAIVPGEQPRYDNKWIEFLLSPRFHILVDGKRYIPSDNAKSAIIELLKAPKP
jgi:hypothetical protein